ncbi:hypothetical protein [Amycolatopsis sp. DG1A-15b]|uniref:hypothetical protein n=1 Tax=Amycolatopsis sp. DG1A-15b TaxID=3052846 RepID=UPI00255BDC97|nr:hypothetical protein [Amycolatopsis sp. DG1A-15b]WIX93251.1 hypothetical protein QRY02_23510 [Amycolatopsis sp. DG1A-15b]
MADRQVRLRHDVRIVSVAAGHTSEEFRYCGITIHCIDDGAVVEQTWIPLGTAPTYADDEALLTAWHTALNWSRSPADTPPT